MTATLLLAIESDQKTYEKIGNKHEKSSETDFSFLSSELRSKITHVSHTSSDGKNSHKLNINNYDTEPSTKYFYFLSEQSPQNNEEAKTLVAKYKNQRVLGIYVSNFDFDKANEIHVQTIQTCSLILRDSKTLSFSDFEDINHSSKIALEARKFCWINKNHIFPEAIQKQVVPLIMLQLLADNYERELKSRITKGLGLVKRIKNPEDKATHIQELQEFLRVCARQDLENFTLYPANSSARQTQHFWQKLRSLYELDGRHQEYIEQFSMLTEISKSIISEKTYDRDTRFQQRVALIGIPLVLVSVFADSADGQQNIINIFRSPSQSVLLLLILIFLASMWRRATKDTRQT